MSDDKNDGQEAGRRSFVRSFIRKSLSAAALGGVATLLLGRQVKEAKALDGSGLAGQITYWDDGDTITGSNNLRWDDANRNFIAGYSGVADGVVGAAISGGGEPSYGNIVFDHYGTVGGGKGNWAGNGGDPGDAPFATVGGGESNFASGSYSTVGGGYDNYASGVTSTVGGGSGNEASSNNSTVGGGVDNAASALSSTVGGGSSNIASATDGTVGGGYDNAASGERATVGGGHNNIAGGFGSTVPGGRENEALGSYSFAAGLRAKVSGGDGDGAFLFADSNDKDFKSTAANEFAVRCTGGARFVTEIDPTGNPTKQVTITSSGTVGIGTTTPAASLHAKGGDVGVLGEAAASTAVPIVAKAASGQTTSIQEWRNSSGTAVAAVDKWGRIGVKTKKPAALIHAVASGTGAGPPLQLDMTGGGPLNALCRNYANGATNGSGLLGRFARGTRTTPANVQVGDRLGFNIFGGYAGGAFHDTAAIEAFVDSGTVGGSSLPTYIRFCTTPNSSVTAVSRMVIDKDGNLLPTSDDSSNCGDGTHRWKLVRAVTVTPGDLLFENGVRATEERGGLAFHNAKGTKIALLDSEGNFHIKGKFIEDL